MSNLRYSADGCQLLAVGLLRGMSILEMTLCLVAVATLTFALLPFAATDNIKAREEMVADTLQDLSGGEKAYYAYHGRYGSLAELAEADPAFVDPLLRLGERHGYKIEVIADGAEKWYGFAVPKTYKLTGRKSFYIDETGILRGGDLGRVDWVARNQMHQLTTMR